MVTCGAINNVQYLNISAQPGFGRAMVKLFTRASTSLQKTFSLELLLVRRLARATVFGSVSYCLPGGSFPFQMSWVVVHLPSESRLIILMYLAVDLRADPPLLGFRATSANPLP